MRREYEIESININYEINKVIIDDHVDKHADHIDDWQILKLVRYFDGFKYFQTKVLDKNKFYKLIWLIEEESSYDGIITVFRDRRIK